MCLARLFLGPVSDDVEVLPNLLRANFPLALRAGFPPLVAFLVGLGPLMWKFVGTCFSSAPRIASGQLAIMRFAFGLRAPRVDGIASTRLITRRPLGASLNPAAPESVFGLRASGRVSARATTNTPFAGERGGHRSMGGPRSSIPAGPSADRRRSRILGVLVLALAASLLAIPGPLTLGLSHPAFPVTDRPLPSDLRASIPSPRSSPLGQGAISTATPPDTFAATISLCNGTIMPAATEAVCGQTQPFAALYDAADNIMFVANAYGFGFNDYVTAYDGRTHQVLYTISPGWSLDAGVPGVLGLDSVHDNLYIAEPWAGPSNTGQLQIVNASSGTIVATIPMTHPYSSEYDADNHVMYVGRGSGGLAEINSTSYHWFGNVTGATGSAGLLYDHAHKVLYESNYSGNTLEVYSPVTTTHVVSISVGSGPEGLALDPRTGLLYSAGAVGQNVSVVNTTTHSLLTTIYGHGLSSPRQIAYDAANGSLYVAGWGSRLTVLAGANHSFVASILIGSPAYATGVAYDAYSKTVFVADQAYGAPVWIVDPVHANAITSLTGISPRSAAYDARHQLLYVADAANCQVLVVNVTTGRMHPPIAAGCNEQGVAFDPKNGELFVTNLGPWYGYGTVTVVNTTSRAVVATISIGYYTTGILYDAKDDAVFVLSYYNTTEINASTNQWVRSFSGAGGGYGFVGGYSNAMAFDPTHDILAVAAGWVYGLNVSNHTVFASVVMHGAGASGVALDPKTHEFYVSGSGTGNVTVLNSTTFKPVTNLTICYRPNSVAYDPASAAIFVACPAQNDVNRIDPIRHSVVADLSLGASGSATNAFPMQILTIGSAGTLATVNARGSVTLISAVASGVRSVSFLEEGLPIGPGWSIQWGALHARSHTPLLTVLEVTRTTYSYRVHVPAGWIATHPVSTLTGKPWNVVHPVGFARNASHPYGVTVGASGLVPGTAWSVSAGSLSLTSTEASLRFLLPNGTYAIHVHPIRGYQFQGTPASSANVNGANVTLNVTFVRLLYNLTIAETGLPTGTKWTASVNGASLSTVNASLVFPLPNGSFAFALHSKGYGANPASGTVSVYGAAVTKSIVFT